MSSSTHSASALEGAKNIFLQVDAQVLHVRCDLSKDFGFSSTGKSVTVASTSGNKELGNSGIFLGVNVFTKDMAKRSLKPEAIAALRQDDFQSCGEGCAWRVEGDGVTLCVKIDFSAVKEREASSGKTVLLATSAGFKAVAKTGISFSMNCYRKKDAQINVGAIATAEPVSGLKLHAGDAAVTTDNGFIVDYATPQRAALAFTGNKETLTETVSLHGCKLGDATVSLFVSPLKPKRGKSESGAPEPVKTKAGGLVSASSEKVRNAAVSCSSLCDNDDFTVRVEFDPSKSSGRSASGKSFTVGTTSGFQVVAGPDGVPLCRLQFNAYRPAPPVDKGAIKTAVREVLSKRTVEEMQSLKVGPVASEVRAMLGVGEEDIEDIADTIKSALAEEFTRASQSQEE